MDIERARDEILLAVLPNVAFDGWTDEALRSGAVSAGYDPSVVDIAFADGIAGLASHFVAWQCRSVATALAAEGAPVPHVGGRVRNAMRAYFRILEPYREAQRKLLGWLALPPHAALGVRMLADVSDVLWWEAGDRSTDFSHYTRRLTLGSLIAAATLFWLDDESPEAADTLAFIDRRLADLAGFGRVAGRLRQGNPFPGPRRFWRQCRRRWDDQSTVPGAD